MEQNKLGQTGIDVSVLGLGTVKFGRNEQVKYPQSFTLPNDQQIETLLDQARELGINLLDTAPAYGTSEIRLGQLLTDRKDWIMVSKVGEQFNNGTSIFDYSEKTILDTIHQSLKNVKTDYLDVVLLHSNGKDMHIIQNTAGLETLDRLKQQGLIRAYGMSTKTTEGGLWTLSHCDVVMATRNRVDTHDQPVLEQALRLNKGVLIKKGLNSGHAAKSAGGAGIADAIRYVLGHPAVDSLILGTINPEHLAENACIVNNCDKI